VLVILAQSGVTLLAVANGILTLQGSVHTASAAAIKKAAALPDSVWCFPAHHYRFV